MRQIQFFSRATNGGAVLILATVLCFTSNAYASEHWVHRLYGVDDVWEAGCPDDTHHDENGPPTTPQQLFDDNVDMGIQYKVGRENTGNCPLKIEAYTLHISGTVQARRSWSVTVGEAENLGYSVELAGDANAWVGGKVGYTHSWTSQESESESILVAVGAGITSDEPRACMILDPGKKLVFPIHVWGKSASQTHEVKYEHYCRGTHPESHNVMSCVYPGHNTLIAKGLAAEQNPCTVVIENGVIE